MSEATRAAGNEPEWKLTWEAPRSAATWRIFGLGVALLISASIGALTLFVGTQFVLTFAASRGFESEPTTLLDLFEGVLAVFGLGAGVAFAAAGFALQWARDLWMAGPEIVGPIERVSLGRRPWFRIGEDRCELPLAICRTLSVGDVIRVALTAGTRKPQRLWTRGDDRKNR